MLKCQTKPSVQTYCASSTRIRPLVVIDRIYSRNYQICKKHIQNNSTVIGDEDTSLTYASKLMGWNRTQIKAYTEEAFEKLQPVDDVCNRFKFFINKHRGFKKDLLQDYINLFFFIDNEMHKENDIYKVTIKLLKRMFNTKSK